MYDPPFRGEKPAFTEFPYAFLRTRRVALPSTTYLWVGYGLARSARGYQRAKLPIGRWAEQGLDPATWGEAPRLQFLEGLDEPDQRQGKH